MWGVDTITAVVGATDSTTIPCDISQNTQAPYGWLLSRIDQLIFWLVIFSFIPKSVYQCIAAVQLF